MPSLVGSGCCFVTDEKTPVTIMLPNATDDVTTRPMFENLK